MLDKLDFSVLTGEENSNLRIDAVSGDLTNTFRLETMGALCRIKGRTRVKVGKSVVTKSFSYSMGQGKISLMTNSSDSKARGYPLYVDVTKSLTAICIAFDDKCPIQSISLKLGLADCDVDNVELPDTRKKSVLLLQPMVTIKSEQSLRAALGVKMTDDATIEVLIDKVTIFHSKVTLPRLNNYNIDVNVELPESTKCPSMLSLSSFTSFGKMVRAQKFLFGFIVFILIIAALIVRNEIATYRDFVTNYFMLHPAIYFMLLLLCAAVLLLVVVVNVVWRLFSRTESNGKSFFVNGWQAWSYCGVVLQGKRLALYGLPGIFVRSFHDGGVGTAMPINLGFGDKYEAVTVPARSRTSSPSKGRVRMPPEIRPATKDSLASDMFTVLSDTRSKYGVVVGFLSQRQQFGCIAVNDRFDRMSVIVSGDGVALLPGDEFRTDWLSIYTINRLVEPFAAYMAMSSKENKVSQLYMPWPDNGGGRIPPAGWCSWYHFFEKVSELDLLSNLECMKRIRKYSGIGGKRHGFNLFQVDDGYQSAWGDWSMINSKKFSSDSMSTLVDKIKEADMIGGIWMAPFSCDKSSSIAKAHPDWILKKNGSLATPSNSGHCGKWFYGLDITNPKVQEHVRSHIDMIVNKWGFRYLKLDFLYSCILYDSHDSYYNRSLTSAQAIQIGMQLICKQGESNSTMILGCGAPIGSAIGRVHVNRISAGKFDCVLLCIIWSLYFMLHVIDAGLTWDPEFPLPKFDQWNLPCGRNMVRNTICRMFMHGKWWINDPDCVILRSGTSFTDDELMGILAVKAMSGGSIVISDDLDSVPLERIRLLLQVLPPTNVSASPLDLLERETPELLRLRLSSSYVPPIDIMVPSMNSSRSSFNLDGTSDIKVVTSQSLGSGSSDSFDSPMRSNKTSLKDHIESILFSSTDASDSRSVKPFGTPEFSRASIKKSFMFTSGTDLKRRRKERKQLIRMFEADHREREEDLQSNWIVFSACNWSANPKSHFLSLREVVGEVDLARLVARLTLLGMTQRKKKLNAFRTPDNSIEAVVFDPLVRSDQHSCLLYLYDFWREKLTCQVVDLSDDSSEVAFLDVPSHSARIYSVGILFDSLFPRYIGSNLHFSCGSEVKRIHIVPTPFSASSFLLSTVSTDEENSMGTYKKAMAATTPEVLRGILAGDEQQHSYSSLARGSSTGLFGEDSFDANEGLRNPNELNGEGSIKFNGRKPMVRTMCIKFQEGSLREQSWGGFILLFLPVRPSSTLTSKEIVDRLHIMGSAWVDPDGVGVLICQYPTLIASIKECECNVFGVVVKIPVSASRSVAESSSRDSQVSVDTEDSVTISWIFDMKDEVYY